MEKELMKKKTAIFYNEILTLINYDKYLSNMKPHLKQALERPYWMINGQYCQLSSPGVTFRTPGNFKFVFLYLYV